MRRTSRVNSNSSWLPKRSSWSERSSGEFADEQQLVAIRPSAEMSAKTEKAKSSRRMNMKMIVLCALLALSILGEMATVASAGPFEAFGTDLRGSSVVRAN